MSEENATPMNERLVKFGTLKKMFKTFGELMPRGSSSADPSGLKYDKSSGRYTNASIKSWLDSYANGLTYGVQIPLYSSSPDVTATKTDANAGLVLEPSTNTSAGRNDYVGKKLFMCPRVNGGVDEDGMPYVTAIEGIDDRFDTTENTWALTPVYYAKYTTTDDYVWQQYCDSPIEGFSPCAGAYTASNELRPYILRACYMDSDGNCSTKSGTIPASATVEGQEGYYPHSFNTDFEDSQSREDGLAYLSFGDITYQTEFMQLMLGVKAPKSVAKGCIGYGEIFGKISASSTGRSVTVASASAASFRVGSYVNVGTALDSTSAATASIAHAVRITAIEITDNTAEISLELDDDITVAANNWIISTHYRNGSCDDILGTYGCFDEDGMTDGMAPFRFQNVEWQLGLDEVMPCMISQDNMYYIAPDITVPADTNPLNPGWTSIGEGPGGGNYIKDYATVRGARIPVTVGATSTTGYMVLGNDSTTRRGVLIGGDMSNAAQNGVGRLNARAVMENYGPQYGSRPTSIGRSKRAD